MFWRGKRVLAQSWKYKCLFYILETDNRQWEQGLCGGELGVKAGVGLGQNVVSLECEHLLNKQQSS